LEFRLLVLTQV